MTILAGQSITAAMLNKMANPPRARVLQSVAQSLPNNVFTAISFEEEADKVNVFHNSTGDRTFLRCMVAGVYACDGLVCFGTSGTGLRSVKWQINGVDVPGGGANMVSYTPGQPALAARSIRVPLAVDDELTLLGFQNSGGALSTYVAADYIRSSMEIFLIRDDSL